MTSERIRRSATNGGTLGCMKMLSITRSRSKAAVVPGGITTPLSSTFWSVSWRLAVEVGTTSPTKYSGLLLPEVCPGRGG